ncbi:MAG TPA: galactokinase [Verrucomicrobiales bacterium]|nr:galactokinase [Verrucomicrobiales bacterium]
MRAFPPSSFEWLRCGSPSWIVSAPGRVNLIGEHVDYCGGYVLPAAIELRTWMAARLRGDGLISIETEDGLKTEFSVNTPPEPGPEKWSNYLRGVLAGCQQAGLRVPGLTVRVATALPLGGGLASSAAFTVAFATLLEQAAGSSLGPQTKAQICQDAESFAGVPSGCMDMMASINARAGHAMLIDCSSGSIEQVSLGITPPALVIINTGVKHDLADGGYAARHRETGEAARLLGVPSLRDFSPGRMDEAAGILPATLFRRTRHVVTEIQRTLDFVAAATSGDWQRAGQLMNASHESLRLDFEVSCPELDLVANKAWSLPGVIGCRMTGGGFGGCCVALVRPAARQAAQRLLSGLCRMHLPQGSGVLVTSAASGAEAAALTEL